MNEQTFEQQRAELVAQIEALPAAEHASLELLAEQTFRRQQEFSEMFNNVGEAIDSVRCPIGVSQASKDPAAIALSTATELVDVIQALGLSDPKRRKVEAR